MDLLEELTARAVYDGDPGALNALKLWVEVSPDLVLKLILDKDHTTEGRANLARIYVNEKGAVPNALLHHDSPMIRMGVLRGLKERLSRGLERSSLITFFLTDPDFRIRKEAETN